MSYVSVELTYTTAESKTVVYDVVVEGIKSVVVGKLCKIKLGALESKGIQQPQYLIRAQHLAVNSLSCYDHFVAFEALRTHCTDDRLKFHFANVHRFVMSMAHPTHWHDWGYVYAAAVADTVSAAVNWSAVVNHARATASSTVYTITTSWALTTGPASWAMAVVSAMLVGDNDMVAHRRRWRASVSARSASTGAATII